MSLKLQKKDLKRKIIKNINLEKQSKVILSFMNNLFDSEIYFITRVYKNF